MRPAEVNYVVATHPEREFADFLAAWNLAKADCEELGIEIEVRNSEGELVTKLMPDA